MVAIEGANVDTEKCPSVQVDVTAIDNEPLVHSERTWPKGWRPYLALFAGFCAMANCWYVLCTHCTHILITGTDVERGLIMSFGPYFRYYDEHLLPDADDAMLGIIGSLQAFLVLSFSIVVGRLLDARLHRYVAFAGAILTVLGHLLLSFTSQQGLYGQGNYGLILLTQGFIGGIGEACYFVYSSQLAVQWFPRHRYFAVGVTSAGAAAGGAAYPVIISSLIDCQGFNRAVRYQAGIVAVVSFIIIVFGNPPPSAIKIDLARLLKRREWFDRAAWRCRPCLLLAFSTAFIFLGYSPLLYHVTEWAEQEKFKVLFFLSIMNG